MLQIVLFILKIIGMILLAVLGLVLGLLILILAAPVCYRINGSWKEEKQASVRISWLYHIVGVMIDLNGQASEIKIRIFGKILGQEKEKTKKKKKKRKSEPEKKDEAPVFNASSAEEPDTEPEWSEEPEAKEKVIPSEASATEKKKKSETKASEKSTAPKSEKPKKEAFESTASKSEKPKEEVFESTVSKPEKPKEEAFESTVSKPENLNEEESFEPIILTEEEVKELEEHSRESLKLDSPISGEREKEKSHPKKKNTSKAPQNAAAKEKETNPAVEMAKTGWNFIQNPNVKKLLKKLWKSICRILHHVLPRKLNVKAHLGFEDPSLNGKIAEAAAFLYAFYPKQFELVSDFEEEIIEVEGDVKGWFVPGYLLLAVIGMGLRVVLNKECRMLYKNIKTKR